MKVNRILVVALLCVGGAASYARWRQGNAPVKNSNPMVVSPDTELNRELVKALTASDVSDVEKLLKSGANADAKVSWPNNPQAFPVAMLARQRENDPRSAIIFRKLLEYVKDVNATDQTRGLSLLSEAIVMHDLDSVKLLIQKGADVNLVSGPNAGKKPPKSPDHPVAHVQNQPMSMLLTSTPLRTAMLETMPRDPNPSEITVYLLDHGANPNLASAEGGTPLMSAAMNGQVKLLKLLLAKGADPGLRDYLGRTALDYAGIRGAEEIVALLRDRSPMTLGEAAQFGDLPRVKDLLSKGAKVNEGPVTPLMEAATNGQVEAAKVLLDNGAWLTARNEEGKSALDLAAENGEATLVKLLLARGANPNDATTKRDNAQTPLMLAVRESQADVVDALLAHRLNLNAHDQGARAFEIAIVGASPNIVRRGAKRNLRQEDSDLARGQNRMINALLKAGVDVKAHHGASLVVAISRSQLDLVQYLLGRGVSVNARGENGQTALLAAIEAIGMSQGEEEIEKMNGGSGLNPEQVQLGKRLARKGFDLLVSRGADVNLSDDNGTTPLMACAGMTPVDVPAALLKKGARINAEDHFGGTALLSAATSDDPKYTEWLIKHGALVNHRNKQGLTCLSIVIDDRNVEMADPDAPMSTKQEHPAMVKLLLSHGATFTPDDLQRAKKLHHSRVMKLLEGAKNQMVSGQSAQTRTYVNRSR